MPRWILRVALAVALGVPAAHLALTTTAAPLIALGIAEVAGAILLVIPRTRRIGAIALLAVLAVAAALHALAGEVPPLAFVAYAAALAVTLEAP